MSPEKATSSAYEMFLDKGITGAVAVLALMALVWAVTRLLKSKDDRIKDQGLFADTLKKSNEGLGAVTVEVNKTITALTVTVQNLEKSVRDLDVRVSSLRDEQVRLTASLTTPMRGGGGGGRR